VRRARHRNIANALVLTEQQRAGLAAARKAAMEATKDIEGHKERGKAIREQMAAARDTILTDEQKRLSSEQKAEFQELRENHKGRGKGNVGPGGEGRGKGNAGPGGKGRGKGVAGAEKQAE